MLKNFPKGSSSFVKKARILAGAGALCLFGIALYYMMAGSGTPSLVAASGGAYENAQITVSEATALSLNERAKKDAEERLNLIIEDILEKTLGAGKAKANVSLDMSFDKVVTSKETFSPDSGVVVSQKTVIGDAADEESVTYAFSKETVNREAGAGTIKRLSAAVLIDGEESGGVYRPRSAEEMKAFKAIIASAIGYNPARGDTLEVVNVRFNEPAIRANGSDNGGNAFKKLLAKAGITSPNALYLTEGIAFFLVLILVVLLVVKPLLNDAVGGQSGKDKGAGGQDGSASSEFGSGGVFPADIDKMVKNNAESALAVLRFWLKGGDVKKAAIIALSLSDTQTAKLFALMSDEEIRKICDELARLDTLPFVEREEVYAEFALKNSEFAEFAGGYRNAEKLLFKTLPEDRALSIMEKVGGEENLSMWERLSKTSEQALASYLKNEYPQTVAVVLSKIAPKRAAKVLELLGENFAMEVMMRMLRMDEIAPEVMESLEKTLNDEFLSNQGKKSKKDSHDLVAKIFNAFDSKSEEKFMRALESRNKEAAGRVMEKMFSFDDIIKLDTDGIIALLRHAPKDKLILALVGAKEAVKDIIFANMSERAYKMMIDDMNALGRKNFADVKAAQGEIAALIRDLIRSGEITFAFGDDDGK